MPGARDPWTLLEQAPGVLLDRVDVAGADGVQPVVARAAGAGIDQNTYTLDGVVITDPQSLEIDAVLLRLRLARGSAGDDRRHRRAGHHAGRGDQPGDAARHQRLERRRALPLHRRRLAVRPGRPRSRRRPTVLHAVAALERRRRVRRRRRRTDPARSTLDVGRRQPHRDRPRSRAAAVPLRPGRRRPRVRQRVDQDRHRLSSSPTACRRSSTANDSEIDRIGAGPTRSRRDHPRPRRADRDLQARGLARASGRRSTSRRTCHGSRARSIWSRAAAHRRAVARCRGRLQRRLSRHHQHPRPRAGPPRDQRVLRRRRREPRDDAGRRASPRRGDHALAVGRRGTRSSSTSGSASGVATSLFFQSGAPRITLDTNSIYVQDTLTNDAT